MDYPYDDGTVGTIVSEVLAETFRASLALHRCLDAARPPVTEIVDAFSFVELRTELAAVLNSPDPFDTEQSRYELSNQLMDRFFDTYVTESGAVATDNMREKSISKKIIKQCSNAVKNVADNQVILSAITQALSHIKSQSNNE